MELLTAHHPSCSPSVCPEQRAATRRQRRGSGGEDSWLQDPSHFLNCGVQADKPALHKTLPLSSLVFVRRHSVSLLAFSFFNTCIDHKLTPATSCHRFSQPFTHSLQNSTAEVKPIVCIHGHARGHTHMQSGISDDIWAIDSLSDKIMINFMAMIYMKSLYYVH